MNNNNKIAKTVLQYLHNCEYQDSSFMIFLNHATLM